MTQAIVESTAFARAMAMIDAMVPVKDTIPILSNVLVEAGDEGVMLTGNNMDQMVRILVPAEIAGHFSAAVSARKLRTIAASVENGGQLRLEPGPHLLKIAAGRSKWALNTLPAGDFPILPAPAECHEFMIDAAKLLTMLARVAPAISTEPHRYYLNGIYMHGSAAGLNLVATNGHILCRDIDPGCAPENAPDVILPHAFVSILLRFLPNCKGDVSFRHNHHAVAITGGRTTIISKAIDGSFPDYERIIPKGAAACSVAADRNELLSAIAQASLVCEGKTRSVVLRASGDSLAVIGTAESADNSESLCRCEAGGEPLHCKFNVKYLTDMINAAGGETARISGTADGGPHAFSRIPEDNFIGVAMPMRM